MNRTEGIISAAKPERKCSRERDVVGNSIDCYQRIGVAWYGLFTISSLHHRTYDNEEKKRKPPSRSLLYILSTSS